MMSQPPRGASPSRPAAAGNGKRKNNIRSLEEERRKRRRAAAPQAQPAPQSHAPYQPGSIDTILLLVVISLVLFGIVMVFSSSYYYALTHSSFGGDMYHFVKLQIAWSAIGFVGLCIAANFSYRILRRFSGILYWFSVVCLVLVQIIGEEIQGSKRWLGVGPIGFQPSEVAKIAVILFLADYVSRHQEELGTLKGFLKAVAVLTLPTVLVAISNLSTAIVIFAIGVTILFVASPKIWYFVVAGFGAVGALAVLLLAPMFAYRMSRIRAWLDPFGDILDKGFQIVQSLYAVASGGMFGLGLGQSRQKFFVPEPYNDIIFAIICEELGMVGAAIVILLFVVLVWRGTKIALEARDFYGTLVAAGIVMLIGVQVIINIAVATNSMPNTGMQLPFISYGGSGMVFTLGSMGILLNISRYRLQ